MKKIKMTESQRKKLMEKLVEKSKIDGYLEKGDHTALVHHYMKSDDRGKADIIDAAKAHAKGGEVVANKIALRARDAQKRLEETNGVIDGISDANDTAIDKLIEQNDGQIAGKHFADGKHGKGKKAFYVEGEIVDAGFKEDDLSDGKPMPDFKAKPMNEQKAKQADDADVDEVSGGMDDAGAAMDENIVNEFVDDLEGIKSNSNNPVDPSGMMDEIVDVGQDTLDETTVTTGSNGSYSSKYFISGPGQEKDHLQYPGGSVVHVNPKTHDSGVNSFITSKGKLKENTLREDLKNKLNESLKKLSEEFGLEESNIPVLNINIDENSMIDETSWSSPLPNIMDKPMAGNSLEHDHYKVTPRNVVRKVQELQELTKAEDSDGDRIMVIDKSSTAEVEMSFVVTLKDNVVTIHEFDWMGKPAGHPEIYNFNRNWRGTHDDDETAENWIYYDCMQRLEWLIRLYKRAIKNAGIGKPAEVDETKYFKPLKPIDNITAKKDDFAHYFPKKKMREDEISTMSGEDYPADKSFNEPDVQDKSGDPQFTTHDLIEIINGVIGDVGEDHPVAKHLMQLIMQYGDQNNPDSPVSSELVQAFREALPDNSGEQNTEENPIPEVGAGVANMQESAEGDEADMIYQDLSHIFQQKRELTPIDIEKVAHESGFPYEYVEEIAQYILSHAEMSSGEIKDFNNNAELTGKYGFEEPYMANESLFSDTQTMEDEVYNELMDIYKQTGHLSMNDINGVCQKYHMNYNDARDIALDVKNGIGEVDETTGAASSGQYSGPLMRRPNRPEDYIFETGDENHRDWKYIESNLADFTDSDGLLKQAFGEENVHIEKEAPEGHVAFIREANGDEYKIGLLKDGSFFVKMNDDNYDQYNVFGSLNEIIETIKSFHDEMNNGEDMSLQEEYNKPSTAMSFLKKVHQATAAITDSEMKKAGDVVKKGEETSGVQFTGKVEDTPQIKKEKEDGQIFDETTVQPEIDMIPKGMQDLTYANEQSPIFKKNFENGLNPVIKSPEVTDQFGNKFPAEDHANVIDSGLGEKLIDDVKKKQAEAKKEPAGAQNFIQRTQVVKENEEIVITEDEQKKIDEDVEKMKKLLGYRPSQYASTKGNTTNNDLFKTRK